MTLVLPEWVDRLIQHSAADLGIEPDERAVELLTSWADAARHEIKAAVDEARASVTLDHDDESELRQWRKLFDACAMGVRLLPDPTLTQEVAFVAFNLDRLRFPEQEVAL